MIIMFTETLEFTGYDLVERVRDGEMEREKKMLLRFIEPCL